MRGCPSHRASACQSPDRTPGRASALLTSEQPASFHSRGRWGGGSLACRPLLTDSEVSGCCSVLQEARPSTRGQCRLQHGGTAWIQSKSRDTTDGGSGEPSRRGQSAAGGACLQDIAHGGRVGRVSLWGAGLGAACLGRKDTHLRKGQLETIGLFLLGLHPGQWLSYRTSPSRACDL